MNFLIYRPLTELEFLSKQTLVNVTGSRTSNGVIVSHVIPNGSTFVLIGASATTGFITLGDANTIIDLRDDGTVIESCTQGINLAGANSSYYYLAKGYHIDGDGILAIDINLSSLTSGRNIVVGNIYGYEINT